MKRSLILLVSLFLYVGTMWAQTFPETSTAEAPKYYTIASYSRGGYLTSVGEGKSVEHIATTKGSLWYFTQADENGGLYFCNMAGGFLAADMTMSETAGVWYVLPNGVNTEGASISSTNPISNVSCIDANNHNTGVGAWRPQANDWEGTTWVFAEVTDFSAILNVDEAKETAKAELDVLASVPVIYPDVAEAKSAIDAIEAEGTGASQLSAAIDAVDQCVTDYKTAALQALGGRYFTINTPARESGFMTLAGNQVSGAADASSSAAIWQFECVDGVVKVFNPYTGKYLCEPGNNSTIVAVTENAATAGAYQLVVNADAENDEAKVKLTSNGKSIHMDDAGVLVRWDNGGASEWTVVEVVPDITKEIVELLEANAGNHAEVPALGQYSTAGYNALQDALLTVTTFKQVADAVAAFESTKCLPVFTIDGVWGYALGMSVYESEDGSLLWRETEHTESMLWTFDMTDTIVDVTDNVVVRNLATGNLFWGASFIQVTETSEAVADDGIFLFYTEGTGAPVHADQAGQTIVRWNNLSANSASAWKFTFVGTTYGILDLPVDPEIPSGPVTSLSDADPTKCYSIVTNGRGAWAVSAAGSVFSSTSTEGLDIDAADARQQFAILSANGTDYYLYSVSAKKFVTREGTLVPFTGDAIALADASSIEAGRVQVRFRDYSNAYINLGNQGQMLIDSWGTIDNGNAVLIAEAGDFDATEALAILADPEGTRKTYLVAQAQELLAANASNHAVRPALGQYGTEAYENLAAIVVSDTATAASVEHFIAAFEASKCLPVFTIDGVNDYAAGMSIYDDEGQYLRWKATDRSDESMLWSFDMTDTIVGVTDKVVIKNLATGNLFMGNPPYEVSYIRIAETAEDIADDGLFLMFREEDTEYAIWASQSGVVLPSQGIFSVSSTSAWKFTYVGTTYGADDELPDAPEDPILPDTMVTESYNWAGVYTVRAEGLEILHDGFTASESFEMEVVYIQEDKAYYVSKMLGYDITQVVGHGIPFIPSADDFSKAEIRDHTRLVQLRYDENSGEYFKLCHVDLIAATPLTITRIADGTFTISDFCVVHCTQDNDTGDCTDTPAAYYRGVTAKVEYTQMPIEFKQGEYGWMEGTEFYDGKNLIVGYTSPLYRFEDKVETFRMTINRNGRDDKYFCLSELELYDGDGNRIELTEENVTSNADHNALNPNHQDGGGIPALFDGDTQTFFHSAWQNMPAEDHYLQITLPNGGYDAFSFRMLSRALSVENGDTIGQEDTFPGMMVIDVADTPHRDALEALLNRAKGYNPYSGSELGYYIEDFGYLLDAIAKAEALLLGEPSEAECEAMVAELSLAVGQFESSDKTFRLPEPGKAYRIVSALPAFYELQSVEKAITINASDNTLWWGDLCPDSLQQEFVFEPVLSDSGVHLSWNMNINLGNGTSVTETQYFYNVKNVATGLYASYSDSAKFHLDEQPCTVYLTCFGVGQFGLKFRVENEYGGDNIYTVHAGDHNEGVPSDSIGDYGGIFGMTSGIVSWYGGLDTPSAWYIREYPVQTDTVPSLELVGVTPDSETSEAWVSALTLSFNKEVDVWSLSFDVRGMNTGEKFHINSHRIGENSEGGSDLTLYLGDADDGWTKVITVPDTYTCTIPAGAIKSVDGEDLPETTITFTVDGTFPVVSYSPVETTRLEQIELTFDKVIEGMNIYYGWNVYNEEGDAVAYVERGSGHGSKTVELGLNKLITTPGKYSLRIFAGAFTAEGDMPNIPADLTFTVVEDTQNPAKPGDVNSDGSYTMSDVVMMVNAVLEKEQASFNAAVADMNSDGVLTMADVVGVLRLVLTDDPAMAPARSASSRMVEMPELSAGELEVMDNGCAVLPVALNNSEAYSAFQVDVVIPAGMELAEATLTGRAKASHAVAWNTLADGTVRIVAYAIDNATFRGNEGALLNLVLKTSGNQTTDAEVLLTDGLFATVGGAEHRAADLSVMMRSGTTGIGKACEVFGIRGMEGAVEVVAGTDVAVSIYATTGQLVKLEAVKAGKNVIALPAGVYVINGNKVIVK